MSIDLFEKELKDKLALKTGPYQTPENAMFKAFKYFDLQETGFCDYPSFLKFVRKLGIYRFSDEAITNIFDVYDTEKKGVFEYKSFISQIYGSNSFGQGALPKIASKAPVKSSEDELMGRLRSNLGKRGIKGIFSVAKAFRIIDFNNSHSIDKNEFNRINKEYRLDLTVQEIDFLFEKYDFSRNGVLLYDEFLRMVKGEMNEYRKTWVKKAFSKMDRDGSGVIDLADVKGVYNASFHPDVKAGKKTENEVLIEFLETFEQHYNKLHRRSNDGKVTMDEFQEYYNNISMSIDDDAYFELMMKNCWRLEGADTLKNEVKGWGNREAHNKQKLASVSPMRRQYRNTSQLNGVALTEQSRGASPLNHRIRFKGEKKEYRGAASDLAPWTRNEEQLENKGRGKTPILVRTQPYDVIATEEQKTPVGRSGKGRGLRPISSKTKALVTAPDEKLRNKLKKRGAVGLNSFRRVFKIYDDDKSKSISFEEFLNILKDYRVDLTESEASELFSKFDANQNNQLDYDEFLRGVVGEMNNFRKNIVRSVFDRLDADKSGVLEVHDLKGIYSASVHPDVISGKKKEEEVLGEFLANFETHFSEKVNF